MTIQELCKERRGKLNLTYQEIADRAELPLITVKKFFTADIKSPSLFTAAPICAVLGISLDAFFHIGDHLTANEETLNAEKEGLERYLSSKDETISILYCGIKTRNRIIAALLGIIIIVTAYAIYLDMNALNIGFWRG